jgi:hypothetical protein
MISLRSCLGSICTLTQAHTRVFLLDAPRCHRSWNQLGCNYDEKKIRAVADAMVSTGMLSAGYEYVHAPHLFSSLHGQGGVHEI